MIVMLEGISKSGKTSWYERNLPMLREKFGTVTYFHPHLTAIGEMLKQMYFSGDTNNEALAAHYLGLHIAALTEIEKLNKQFGCVVVDRTIMTTIAINVPHLVQKETSISGLCEEDQPWEALQHFYFSRIQNITDDNMLVFFNCCKPDPRYEKMYPLNERYLDLVQGYSNSGGYSVECDASQPVEEVDWIIGEYFA